MILQLSRPLLKISGRGLATASTATKIGIIGCGNVGNAVAHNLSRHGFNVENVYDIDKCKMTAMPKGVKHCSTSREVAENSHVIITGLPRPPNLKAAAEGNDGFLKGLTTDKVWIDHSTTNYEQTQKYDDVARENGAYVLEAPITGGLDALKKGQMVVYIGGDKKAAQAMDPLLKASYNEVFYVGPTIGSAMLVKIVSNMLFCVHLIAMGEVLMLAKRSGLDLKTFWDAIRLGAGNSFAWETGAPFVFNSIYDPGFSMGLQCKDLQLGYDMATKFRVPMEMNQLALSIYRRTQYQLGDDAGCDSPPKLTEMALNESLSIPNFKNWSYDNEIIGGSIHVSHRNIEE